MVPTVYILSQNLRSENDKVHKVEKVKKINSRKLDQTLVKLMSHLRKMTKLTKWKSDKN